MNEDRELIRRSVEGLTPDYDANAHAEFKRYLQEMDATVSYDRFEGENTYERLYRELGYGNLREEDIDVEVSPYTQSDSDNMIDEYFARLNRKKKNKIVKRRKLKEDDLSKKIKEEQEFREDLL